MNRILTLALMASVVALTACSGSGKNYPAPYSSERTAGGQGAEYRGGAEATFEKRMAK